MSDFWLGVGLLLLVAFNFVLIPGLLIRRSQSEEGRTALNVRLYQERLNEMQVEQEYGVLSVTQKNSVLAEAASVLLADTEGVDIKQSSATGKWLPLLVAFLVPALGLFLYLHFGASDKVKLSREFAQPPSSLAQMSNLLERAVNAQPALAESAYSLAQNYMAQGRFDDATQMFERTVSIAGRRPELLGAWANALYFAQNKKWSPAMKALTDEALLGNPNEVMSLNLLGLAAFEDGDYKNALKYWSHALTQINSGDASRVPLMEGIRLAREGILKGTKSNKSISSDAGEI
ncbi:c-type cytochrome biogenesis protein CcmI [Pseudomonas sp.]|uniref:c-type cytochrome biogenesis protein CcmI n=1 Tax=Pseudomonas sp. TaxID=306 RepID=UPI003A9787D5